MAVLSQIKASDNVTYNIRDDYSTWGGRNLLRCSGNFRSTDLWAKNGAVTFEVTTTDGYQCLHCKGDDSHGSSIVGNGDTGKPNVCINLEPSTTYTYSAWAKFAGTGALTISSPLHYWIYKTNSLTGIGASNGAVSSSSIEAVAINGTKYASGATLPASTWVRIIFTFTTIAATSDYPYINFRPFTYGNYVNVNNSECWWRDFKLEKGNKPTDWNPAPEDIARFIGNETIELYG